MYAWKSENSISVGLYCGHKGIDDEPGRQSAGKFCEFLEVGDDISILHDESESPTFLRLGLGGEDLYSRAWVAGMGGLRSMAGFM
eukprot:1395021-Amorphochlora_amoeboformis.AAC.1